MSPHKITALPSPSALPEYGITRNGFLPAEPPLVFLPDHYYLPWEVIVVCLAGLLEKEQLRIRIDELPVLSTSRLTSRPQWQRAHLILALLAQGYIWQGSHPSQRLPPAITVPLLEVAAHLEVQPLALYAPINLWNWEPTHPGADIQQPQNQRALHTFTGTEDESWFFVVSNAMEARAAPLLDTMLSAIESAQQGDARAVIRSLQFFERSVFEIGVLLERMDERCDPQIFYHQIRPHLAGSHNMENAGLPHGIFFDEGNGRGCWRKHRGGSNGQSSLVPFLDTILGVDHPSSTDFHNEMRKYMPGPHARFLDDLQSISNIRAFVMCHEEDQGLLDAYNAAVASLSTFRDRHIQLVTRYIIVPSRLPDPRKDTPRVNLASASTKMATEEPLSQELVGTGGTKLIPFLRGSRDETSALTIDAK